MATDEQRVDLARAVWKTRAANPDIPTTPEFEALEQVDLKPGKDPLFVKWVENSRRSLLRQMFGTHTPPTMGLDQFDKFSGAMKDWDKDHPMLDMQTLIPKIEKATGVSLPEELKLYTKPVSKVGVVYGNEAYQASKTFQTGAFCDHLDYRMLMGGATQAQRDSVSMWKDVLLKDIRDREGGANVVPSARAIVEIVMADSTTEFGKGETPEALFRHILYSAADLARYFSETNIKPSDFFKHIHI